MKNLYEASTVDEVKQRLSQLGPTSQRQWGKMDPAQALAHCCAALEMAMATGENHPKRILIGRLLGPIAKKSLVLKGEPMRRNSQTHQSVLIDGPRDFAPEKERLLAAIDHFDTGGPEVCTRHQHFFFGPLTPQEWSALMYQHLDHHLRQFGA